MKKIGNAEQPLQTMNKKASLTSINQLHPYKYQNLNKILAVTLVGSWGASLKDQYFSFVRLSTLIPIR